METGRKERARDPKTADNLAIRAPTGDVSSLCYLLFSSSLEDCSSHQANGYSRGCGLPG